SHPSHRIHTLLSLRPSINNQQHTQDKSGAGHMSDWSLHLPPHPSLFFATLKHPPRPSGECPPSHIACRPTGKGPQLIGL
ncbi:hypothetical protein OC861_007023, partial [Tilletia horrida]